MPIWWNDLKSGEEELIRDLKRIKKAIERERRKEKCPHCGRELSLESCWNGKAMCCRYCGNIIEITGARSDV